MKKDAPTQTPRRRVLSRVLAEDLGKIPAGAFNTFTRPPEPWMDPDLD